MARAWILAGRCVGIITEQEEVNVYSFILNFKIHSVLWTFSTPTQRHQFHIQTRKNLWRASFVCQAQSLRKAQPYLPTGPAFWLSVHASSCCEQTCCRKQPAHVHPHSLLLTIRPADFKEEGWGGGGWVNFSVSHKSHKTVLLDFRVANERWTGI